MSAARIPVSLHSRMTVLVNGRPFDTTRTTAVTCMIAAASITGAEAQQQSPLQPVTVDAPVSRSRPAASKPSAEQLRARAALRRAQRQAHRQQVQAPPAPNTVGAQSADRNPYADPAAPYKVDRLASPKFTEPVANTPRSITVLTKELLDDKNATSLKEVARTTAGVTLGTGEGGNAFGDRFFIRGFDARNDIFIDGVRDPAVSIRENFFTEQVEILRGPASSFAGRGTTGGAINIVTKQAADSNFYNGEATLGTDNTRRLTLDVNQVISPTLSVRLDAMGQGANAAGRDYVFDDRWGGLAAVKWTPNDIIKVTANYIHTDLDGLPDFGVPYNRTALAPFTDTGVPRNTYYGFVNRDFQTVHQDIGTTNLDVRFNDAATLSNKLRVERSVLNYIGTLPEAPNMTNPNPLLWTIALNPQSRYQVTTVVADQTDFTLKYDFGPVRNTAVIGTEFSRERTSIDSYRGLASEALPGGFNGAGSITVPLFAPPNQLPFGGTPTVTGNPTVVPVSTNSAYIIDTANYRDLVIVNGGLRYDDYNVSASKGTSTVSASSGILDYNAGLVMKPLPYASVYAAYATSANPVGAEVDGTSATYGGLNPTAAVNQIFAPERNQAEEVGTKWELFNRHLLVTGALFQTIKENARELIPRGQRNAGTIIAGAAYRIRGIDLGAEGRITDRWSLYGGLVLMDSRVTESAIPTNVGDRLANIAHQSFNLLSKYKVTDRIEVGGQATYVSKIHGGTLLAANQGTVLPDHWRFDGFIEGKLDDHLNLKLAVNNIFDKTYYDAFYQSAAPFVLIAPGRSAWLVLEAKY